MDFHVNLDFFSLVNIKENIKLFPFCGKSIKKIHSDKFLHGYIIRPYITDRIHTKKRGQKN